MTCSPNWLLLIYLQLVSTQLKNSCDISTSVLLLHAINMGNFNLRIQSQIHTLSFNGLRCFPPFSLSQLSVQFSSVAQSCPTLCNHMDCSTPGFPVYHQLLELIHVHWICDAIQPSHPLLFPSSPAFNLSQHQGLFKQVSSSHQVAKVLEFQLQHESFQWIFRTDFP